MGTVHDLLEARGRQGARYLVEGRRGPRIVEAAAGWASDEDISTGYLYSGWCQTALPHKRPVDNGAPDPPPQRGVGNPLYGKLFARRSPAIG